MEHSQLTTLCDKRWNYATVLLSVGKVQTCCRPPPMTVTPEELDSLGIDVFLNSDYQKERRMEMFNGIKHEHCNYCWHDERNNIPSMRGNSDHKFIHFAKSHKLLAAYPKIPITEIKDHITIDSPVLRSTKIELLELVLNNLCDLKCVYCGPSSSSQWASELYKHGEITKEKLQEVTVQKPTQKFEAMFWKWMDQVAIHSLSHINIKGGEPLLTNSIFEFIDKLVLLCKSHNILPHTKTLHIISNLNASDTNMDKFIQSISNLSAYFNIEVMISAESVGTRAEYIRFGLNWSQFEKNVNKLFAMSNDHLALTFMPTVNALNISSLPEFLQWCMDIMNTHSKNATIIRNSVFYPIYLSPLVLTSDFAKYLDSAIAVLDCNPTINDTWQDYRVFLSGIRDAIQLNQLDSEGEGSNARNRFFGFLVQNDSRRSTNFTKTFPEYKLFFDFLRKTYG